MLITAMLDNLPFVREVLKAKRSTL